MKIIIAIFLALLFCLPASAQQFAAADPLADRVPAAVRDDAFTPDGKHVQFASDKWATADKWAAAAFITANVLDAVTTMRALDRGGVESNPLYGKHPSDGKIIGIKLVMVGGILVYHNKYRSPATRKALWAASALLVAVSIHNEGVE